MTDFLRVVSFKTFSGFAEGLVALFIPIYLLEHGYSLAEVILWMLVHHLSVLLFAFFAVKISNKYNLVANWYIRIPVYLLFIVSILLIPTVPAVFIPSAIFSGMEVALFWIPYNILMVRLTKPENMSSALATISNAGKIVGMFTPLISALVITGLGYDFLFVASLLLSALAIIPVLRFIAMKTDFSFTNESFIKIYQENKAFVVPEILDNLAEDAIPVLAIFLFMAGLTVLDIGYLGVITGIAGIIASQLFAHLSDRVNRKGMFRFAAWLLTVSWVAVFLVLAFVATPVWLYIVSTIAGFATGLFANSYGSYMFNRARKYDAQFLVLREIPTITGRAILFVLALTFIHFGVAEYIFLVVAATCLYFCFYRLENLE